MRKSWMVLAGAMILGMAGGGLSGCTHTRVPLTGLSVPVPTLITPLLTPIFGRAENDFRSMSRMKAFEALHAKLAAEYPFGEHKAIDWDGLHEEFAPKIEMAVEQRNWDRYYLLIRAYLFSIPDGMLGMTYRPELLDPGVEASFGLRLMTLSDGRTIAHSIIEGASADQFGVTSGATVLAWNNKPIEEALTGVNPIWAESPAGTADLQRLRALHYLRRSKVNGKAVLTFQAPGAADHTVAGLTATKDDYQGLRGPSNFYAPIGEDSTPVSIAALEGNVFHIRVFFMAPNLTTPFPGRAFRNAVLKAVEEGARAIVLDLRGNGSGVDALIPEFAGHFVSEAQLMQRTAVLDEAGAFTIDPNLDLEVTPKSPQVECPVLVLVNASTSGSCEGLSWILQRQPNIEVMGFFGTSGSYGLAGGEIQMPGDFTVLYPMGRYETDAGILLSADGAGVGGVMPDIQLPITEEAIAAIREEGRDVLLEHALAHLNAGAGLE